MTELVFMFLLMTFELYMKGIVNSFFTFIRWFYTGYLFSALLVVFLHKYATLNVNWLGSTAKQMLLRDYRFIIFLLEVNMDNFNFFGPQYQDIVKSNVSTTKPIEQKNTKEKSKVIRPRTYAIYRRHKDETKNDDHVRMSI